VGLIVKTQQKEAAARQPLPFCDCEMG